MGRRRTPSRVSRELVPVQETLPYPVELYESRIYELEESLAELERALLEPGWLKLTVQADLEFTRDGLKQMATLCRIMAVKNPLIKRGLSLRTAYVWGQGVDIASPSDGESADGSTTQDVNSVLQDFLDDPSNKRTFTSPQAREQRERDLYTDGNTLLALFTSPKTGRVQVRLLPFDEIQRVVRNPDDVSEPWFYRREWTRTDLDGSTKQIVEFYPDLSYQPAGRLRMFRDPLDGKTGRVHWDAPVVHVWVNKPTAQAEFGIPDSYAAIDWARAFKEFLEDWARYMKALTLFVWKITNPGNKKPAVRQRAADALHTDTVTGEPLRSGAAALLDRNTALEAIPKTGASIDADSARPLGYMVAAALDVPVTMLLSDPGLTGARAVAESLDAPTELMAQQRRTLWTDVTETVLNYVIDQAIAAPQGPLKGRKTVGPWDTTRWVLDGPDGEGDRSILVQWPDLDDVPAETIIKGLVDADSTEKVPPRVISRALMQAIGVSNIDEELEKFADHLDSRFGADTGQKVVDAFRRGVDPARTIEPEDSSGAGDTADADSRD